MQQISREQLALRCKTKKHMFRGLKQEGFFLPEERNQLCTLKFLKEVMLSSVFCPKLNQISFNHVQYPPKTEDLIDLFDQYIQNHVWQSQEARKPYSRLLSYMRFQAPDKQFLLGLLSLLTPDANIFKPNYRPQVKQQNVRQGQMISDSQGILSRFQPLTPQEMKKRGSINLLSKKEQVQLQLQRIAEKEQSLRLARQKKEADLLLVDDEEDNFKVKISVEDFEILKKAKLQNQINQQILVQQQPQSQNIYLNEQQALQQLQQDFKQQVQINSVDPEKDEQMQLQPNMNLMQFAGGNVDMINENQSHQSERVPASFQFSPSRISEHLSNQSQSRRQISPDPEQQRQPKQVQPQKQVFNKTTPRRAAAQRCIDNFKNSGK